MLIRKAFKFRIYPSRTQRDSLAVQFGHSRFVYNHYLRVRQEWYDDIGSGLSCFDCINDMAQRLKVESPWLKEASSQVLSQSLMDLDRAYKNFFDKRAGYPKFKSKHGKQSIRYSQDFKLDGHKIRLPKVGWVSAVLHRKTEGEMKNCTVTRAKSGKYFASIQCEVEVAEPIPVRGEVGIDLGLKDFITLSTDPDDKVAPPRFYRKAERRLKIRQRRLSKKKKGSNNREKAKHAVAVQHERVANQRRDFHHKLSRELVDNFGYIALENLNIRGMVKNHKLAKSINDAGWGQFVRFLKYKSDWSGGQVEQVGTFYPSSKTCSACGSVKASLKMSERVWTCVDCGTIHDRDHNAAVNILNETTRGVRESNACQIRPALVATELLGGAIGSGQETQA